VVLGLLLNVGTADLPMSSRSLHIARLCCLGVTAVVGLLTDEPLHVLAERCLGDPAGTTDLHRTEVTRSHKVIDRAA